MFILEILRDPASASSQFIKPPIGGLTNLYLAKNNTSHFKGVSWSKHAKKWRAQIMVARKFHSYGYHSTPAAASAAYQAARALLRPGERTDVQAVAMAGGA